MIEPQYEYRTGIGTDIHRLVPNRELFLGGVQIPYPLGLLGHSDGDVVIHAVIDALLGASGLGDIGTHFSDKDDRWKNVDSKEMLDMVCNRLAEDNWSVVNVDLTIHAEEPRLEPHKGQIKRSIADVMHIDFTAVNVKAKTNEGLDEIGKGHAIAVTAAAMLIRRKKRTLRYH